MRASIRNTINSLLLIATTSTLHAAEWKIEPAVELRAGYDDNVRLSVDDEISSAEARLSPSAKFSVETPRSGASGELRFDFRRFEDDSNLNDDNVRFDVDTFHRMEQSEVGLGLGFIKDTTLDSQLENTGLAFDRVTRNSIIVNPNWSYNFSERTSMRLGYTFRDVDYSGSNSGFTDYTSHSADIGMTRVITERTLATLTLGQERTDNDSDTDSTVTFLQGGARFSFSETLSANLIVGVRRTESKAKSRILVGFDADFNPIFAPVGESIERSDWGGVFNASVNKQFLRWETGLSASRDIRTDVNGVPIEVTRLGWTNLYHFTEILSGNLDIRFYQSESPDQPGARLDRDYYDIQPKFNWDFAEFWRISGSYRYRKQTFENSSEDAVRNAAYLTLTYRWPKIALSR